MKIERLEAFPTQLVLTLVWATVGTALSLLWSTSILWISLISIYAIVVSHWTAHIAWKAERAAKEVERLGESGSPARE